MTDEVYEVLASCIRRIEADGWTAEDCLAKYPSHANELEPMLRVALNLRAAGSLRVSNEFRRMAPARLKLRLQAGQRPPRVDFETGSASLRSRLRGRIPFRPRTLPLIPTIVSVVLVLAMAMGGVVTVADAAGPGDLLFGLDLAVEELRLRLTTDKEDEAELRIAFASERISEAEFELEAEGDVQDIQAALAAFDEAIAGLGPLLSQLDPEQQAIIQEAINSLNSARVVFVRLAIEIEDGELELELESAEDGGDLEEDEADLEGVDGDLEDEDQDELDEDEGDEACELDEEAEEGEGQEVGDEACELDQEVEEDEGQEVGDDVEAEDDEGQEVGDDVEADDDEDADDGQEKDEEDHDED